MTARKPAAKAVKPRFHVVERSLHAQTELGEVVLPLRLSLNLQGRLAELEATNPDDAEAVVGLFPDDVRDVLMDLDILELTEVLGEWAKAIQARYRVTPGESSGSAV